MRKILAVLILSLLLVGLAHGQSQTDLEEAIKTLVPYSQMKLQSPSLTLTDYNDAVRNLAKSLVEDPTLLSKLTNASRGFGSSTGSWPSSYSTYRPTTPSYITPSTDLGTTTYSVYGSHGYTAISSANRIGDFTFYNLYGSDGNSMSGSSNRIGASTFHNLYGTNGYSASGNSNQIGSFTLHNLTGTDGHSVNGTSMQIGGFTFHNLTGTDGSSTSGTTMRIGNIDFTNLHTIGGDD